MSSVSINRTLEPQTKLVLPRAYRNEYTVIRSNVANINDAQIFCFGEFHDNETHAKINGSAVNRLNGNSTEDILLLEAEYSELSVYRAQDKYVSGSIMRKIWDGRDTAWFSKLEAGVLSSLVAAVAGVAAGIYSIYAPAIFTKRTMNIIFNDPTVLSRFLPYCGLFILASLASLCYTKHLSNKWIEDTFEQSNRDMIKTIKENLNYRKIYLIAGAAHLVHRTEKPSAYRRGVDELWDFLKDHKHVILVPKSVTYPEDSDSEDDIMKL